MIKRFSDGKLSPILVGEMQVLSKVFKEK